MTEETISTIIKVAKYEFFDGSTYYFPAEETEKYNYKMLSDELIAFKRNQLDALGEADKNAVIREVVPTLGGWCRLSIIDMQKADYFEIPASQELAALQSDIRTFDEVNKDGEKER